MLDNELLIGWLKFAKVDRKYMSSTTRFAMLSLKLSSSNDVWGVVNPSKISSDSLFFAREALNLSFFSSSFRTSSSCIPTLIK